jgi:hypothetical protein
MRSCPRELGEALTGGRIGQPSSRESQSQMIFNGGKRPFGFDIEGEGKDRRLVPNANEQDALAHARAMRADGKTFRDIAAALVTEFGLKKFDAKSVKRILDRAVA